MKIPDLNVLLYAVNDDDARHQSARAWIEDALSGDEAIGFAWIVVLGFLRITTRSGIFPRPLTTDQALSTLDAWLSAPASVTIEPTPRHLALLRKLLQAAGTAGNLTSDAHLAALAIEHHADVCTFDRDLARFPDVHVTALA